MISLRGARRAARLHIPQGKKDIGKTAWHEAGLPKVYAEGLEAL